MNNKKNTLSYEIYTHYHLKKWIIFCCTNINWEDEKFFHVVSKSQGKYKVTFINVTITHEISLVFDKTE